MKTQVGSMLCLALLLLSAERVVAASPSAMLEDAIAAVEHGRIREAMTQLTTLPMTVLSAPERGRARYLMAHVAFRLKRYPEALQAFGEVLEHYPALGDYAAWNIARIYQEMNAESLHVEALRLLLTRFPHSRLVPQARLALARQLIGVSGAAAEGVRVLEEFFLQHPDDPHTPEAYLWLGQGYEGLQSQAKAVEAYRLLYVRFPTSVEADRGVLRLDVLLPPEQRWMAWMTPAERLERAGRLADANECERALQEIYAIPSAAFSGDLAGRVARRQGLCAFRLRRYRDAIAALEPFRHTLAMDERAPEALYTLGLSYQRDGRADEAERLLHQLAVRDPHTVWNGKALTALGLAYEGRQEVERAIEAYRELMRRFPTADRADELAWRIGWLRYNQRQFSAAVQDFETAAIHFPRSMFVSNARYWQAKALEKTNRRAEARALYEQVASQFPYTYYGLRAQEILDSKHVFGRTIMTGPVSGQALGILEKGTPTSGAQAMLSPTAEFHRVRVDELLALRFVEDAREEVSQLAKHLGEGLSEQVFLAQQYLRVEIPLQAIRTLNTVFSAVAPDDRLRLPLDFWSSLFPQLYWLEVQEAAAQVQLDPFLVLSVIRQESAFSVRAVSRSDARGLMQILPSTGREVSRRLGLEVFRNDLLFEPRLNVQLGTHYLGRLAEAHHGNLILALAAYNAGPARVRRWLQDISTADWDEFIERLPFEETRGYIKNVLRNYGVYQRLYAMSPNGQVAR
jgi:soluble lytic murein transglycosylase